MRQAIKQPKTVTACRLGSGSELEKALISQGKIAPAENGAYRIFSRETQGQAGELAVAGDYVKLDSEGWPYPNSRVFFEQNHRRIGVDTYEQVSPPVQVWFLADGQDEIIAFLQQHKGLVIDPESESACFSAPLWGTQLTAGKDAALLIYRIFRDEAGNITDVDFNFVARDEFDKTYTFL